MKTSFAVVALLWSTAALAEPALKVSAGPRDRCDFFAAARVGALFAEPFNRLGASYLVGVEGGWVAPFLKRHLAVALDFAYTAPEANGSQSDTRVDANGGSYTWHVQQREVMIGLTFFYRHPIGRFVPYAGIGPRLFLLQTNTTGKAGGSTISDSSEESTKVGFAVPVGLGFTLGPGQLFGELQLNYAPIDHRITGDTTTGSLSLSFGYRILF